jgi:hypothetical protein
MATKLEPTAIRRMAIVESFLDFLCADGSPTGIWMRMELVLGMKSMVGEEADRWNQIHYYYYYYYVWMATRFFFFIKKLGFCFLF